MKKQSHKTKDILFGMVLGLLLVAMAVPALAAGVKTIEANYMDIKLVVDGVPITPKDASGKAVEPFVFEGTTYLPVRAVGEALGKDVKWDGETKTVYIGEIPGKINYLVDVCPPYEKSENYAEYHSDKGQFFKMGGKDYSNGFTIYSTYRSYASMMINLNGEYKTLTFNLGHVDGSGVPEGDGASVEVYLDGVYSHSIDLNPEAPVHSVSVPLKNALQLKLIVKNSKGNFIAASGTYGFADAILE